jgi:restriction endonuclease S subunit
MLKQKNYTCEICKTKPDQLSHHKTHLDTMKHKDKKEIFEFKLLKLDKSELETIYKISDIPTIIMETETVEYIYKKLINNDNNTKIDDIIMTSMEKQIIEESKSVSNKEALKDKIHEIHNFLRNNGAGYGMNALKVFNLLYGLKKLEEKNLIDKVKLKRPDCEFSHLLKLANKYKDEELTELILGSVSTSIYRSEISDLLFYEIPQNIKSSVFSYLIKEIDKITMIEKTCNVLLSGKIYEYFIGRDESAISELGAYFTDRHIVDYIFYKLDPNMNEDGMIQSMIDMFGGSGGFTTGYINYLNEKYHGKIDWTKNLDKVHHFDMNEDVIKSAGLEFFCLTGNLPNMNNNLKYKNSFTDEFNNLKFKNIITNPPYGGDKIKQSDATVKRTKVKEYIKKELTTLKDDNTIKLRMRQLKDIERQEKQEKKDSDKTKVSVDMCSARIQKFAKEHELVGNDKEACSLMLMMDMLDIDGTCIGVLKEGVFFNKTYKDLRKCLIENFNVREVVSVPQDQFENTSTKTSIVIFDNTKQKTIKVKFSDLIVEKYTEDKFEEIGNIIVLIENKGDIFGVNDKLVSEATKEEILTNAICSLNGKDYNKKLIVCGNDYELVKLGDICTFLPKSKRNASFGKSEGKYNFYTSSDKVQKCDIADYDEESLIIGDGGIANIKIDDIFSCSDHNHIINTKYNKYIYYLINGNMNFLIDGFSGSVLKNLSKTYLQKLELPIPKSKQKIMEWVNKISTPYDKKNNLEKQIMKLEEEVKNKIKNITKNEECDEVELESFLNFTSGKFKSSDCKEIGLYPFFNGKAIQPDGYSNNYCYDSKEYIILIKDGGAGVGKYGEQIGLGNVFLVNGKCGFTSHQLALELKTNIISIKYLLYVLKINKNNIMDLANYSTGLGTITKTNLNKFKIKIPKNKKLVKEFESAFQEIEQLQTEMKEAEIQYKQYIKELSEESVPTNTLVISENKEQLTKSKIIESKALLLTEQEINVTIKFKGKKEKSVEVESTNTDKPKKVKKTKKEINEIEV